jgi:XTP/dITP diphosphohydrolase
MRVLVVATGNPGKLVEMQACLAGLPVDLRLKPAAIDVEETGQTFLENARLKASQVALATGKWAIADDSGLSIAALQGAPGIYSARYGRDDLDRIARVLQELQGSEDRTACFVCAVAVAQPDGQIALEVEAKAPGQILTAPRGSGGFGYDPIFLVPELNQTFAELSAEQKHQVSHRGRAFAQLVPQLRSLLDSIV